MAKFSAGQMVVCTDSSGAQGDLVCGKTYEVVYMGDGYEDIGFVAVSGVTTSWDEDRFTLLSQTLKENPMKSSTKIPHIHAELIKLWADGAEIECKNNDADAMDTWDAATSPSWLVEYSYRVNLEQTMPETSLTGDFLHREFYKVQDEVHIAVIRIANKALSHFITSGDMAKYLESIK